MSDHRAVHPVHALPALDWVRALAAIAVLVGHVYGYLFVFIPPQYLFARLLTFPFALGHQGVLVFFVLSGFLVGGSVSRAVRANRWSWPDYLNRRLTRLYVVLVPALLLGGAWDTAGLRWLAANGQYAGELAVGTLRAQLAWPVAAGNLAFLQRILVPPFGTNAPLWSLSNEFWYYLLFPCALLVVARTTPRAARVAYSAAVLAIAALLYKEKLEYMSLWLFGWGVWLAPPPKTARWTGPLALAATALLFTAALWTTVAQPHANQHLADGLTALSFCPLLYCLAHRPPVGHPLGTRLAGLAYTLYATHFPPLLFLSAWIVSRSGARWPVDPAHVALGAAAAAALLAYAALVARFTEARTDRVRAWISARLTGSPRTR